MTGVLEVDDLIIDEETGEVLGTDGALSDIAAQGIRGDMDAERVLFAIAMEDGRIEMAASMQRAAIERMERLRKRHQDRADYLRRVFGPDIERWAAAKLTGGKRKSLTTKWAEIRFRRSRERLEVINPDAALEWAKARCPEAVRVSESFLPSLVPDEMRGSALPAALRYHPPGEETVCDIVTKEK